MGIPLTNSNICWDENPVGFETPQIGAFFYLSTYGFQYFLLPLLFGEVYSTFYKG